MRHRFGTFFQRWGGCCSCRASVLINTSRHVCLAPGSLWLPQVSPGVFSVGFFLPTSYSSIASRQRFPASRFELLSNFSEAITHLKSLQMLLWSQIFAGFFFAVLRTWPVLALLRPSVNWTSWSEMWKLRNMEIAGQTQEFYHTHPWFWGGKIARVSPALWGFPR